MAADITIDPFVVKVLDASITKHDIQLRLVPTEINQLGGSGGGGSTRPSSGFLYPRGDT